MTVLEEKLRNRLNPEQFDAAMHMEGPAAIMAGAGSGKTHTLMSRVAHLVDSGVMPERILMLTFTNAAADEMKKRAATLLDERCKNITACTYHKFCNLILRKHGKAIGLNKYTIVSSIEGRNIISYVRSSDKTLNKLKAFPASQKIESIMSAHVNTGLSVETLVLRDHPKYINYVSRIEELIEKTEKYRFDNRKLNYDDLLVYTVKLLEHPDLCRYIAGKYDYIMIDEYQDTNNLQEEIIREIFEYNRNIVVVGDISQSIYGFRGANVENLKNFPKNFTGSRVIELSKNYRSTQEILDFANKVMHNNVQSWHYFDMVSNDRYGELPKIILPLDADEQCQIVISGIQKFHDEDGIPYSEIAVLERGSNSSFGLEKELNLAKIPFEKRGGMKFMDYECIGDMIAFMSVITDPADRISWFRILKLLPGIGDVYAKRIADGSIKQDFLTDAKFSKKTYYNELVRLDTAYKDFLMEENFHLMITKLKHFYLKHRKHIIDVSDLNDENTEKAKEELARDSELVDELEEMTKKYNTLSAFLDDLVLDSLSELDQSEDKLMVSTVHGAKGLEWKVVFMIDCVEGRFPSRISFIERGTLADEEELRCFYVALTRAKDELYILSPLTLPYSKYSEDAEPTHYMDDILDEYLL